MKKRLTPLNITIAFALAAVISPFIFTLGARLKIFDFYDTGQIGDTIGGLTAPVIGLLNAVLLYWTLRRQDELIDLQNRQRNEDKFEALFNRKFELISSLLKSLKLTIGFESTADFVELTEHTSKVYKGENAILMATGMFSIQNDLLHYHKIEGLEWASFMNKVNQIVVEVTWVLSENLNTSFSIQRKKIDYEYLSAHISYIPLLFNEMEEYKRIYPKDVGLDIFKVDQYLRFKQNVDIIKSLDPAPEIKRDPDGKGEEVM
jgi:hypothetical protein